MEKINFCILLFLLFLTSFCTSYDYKYDEYDYEDHYDYADDYSQESNYYYDQNLIAPPNPPQLPPIPFPTPPPPPPPMVMKYMVATREITTEIIDVSNPMKSCVLVNDRLPVLSMSTGGMLGKTPVICGGQMENYDYSNECLLYGTSQKVMMKDKRISHSSVGLNSSMLWITGGIGILQPSLRSTEFVTTERAVNGPTLPETLYSHCSVLFPGNGNVYLIGGRVGNLGKRSTNRVWVVNPSNKFTFAQGPSLITARHEHMCGTMSIGTKSIIVAAGGRNANKLPEISKNPFAFDSQHFLASVEILDPLSNKWVAGPELPYHIRGGVMASSPDGNGVILFGGYRYPVRRQGIPCQSQYIGSILELRSNGQGWASSWITHTAKINPRGYHVVIPVVMDIDACEFHGYRCESKV